jgi:hypothetical protein
LKYHLLDSLYKELLGLWLEPLHHCDLGVFAQSDPNMIVMNNILDEAFAIFYL